MHHRHPLTPLFLLLVANELASGFVLLQADGSSLSNGPYQMKKAQQHRPEEKLFFPEEQHTEHLYFSNLSVLNLLNGQHEDPWCEDPDSSSFIRGEN